MGEANKDKPTEQGQVEKPTGLELLRAPFPANQISKLPKPYKRDSPKGKCSECGGYHGLPALHLDYVGHAALTDRLLDCDPEWNWEPVARREDGTPMTDANGGMWINLTVCGVTRLGYGHADGKKGGDAIKELIGDALRNAAMRFGAALDLWHKGQLHMLDEPEAIEVKGDQDAGKAQADDTPPEPTQRQKADRLIANVHRSKGDKNKLTALWEESKPFMAELPDDIFAEVKAKFGEAGKAETKADPAYDDEIPF